MPARSVPPTTLRKTRDVQLPLDQPQPAVAPPKKVPSPSRRGRAKPDCPGDEEPGFDFWWDLWKR